MSQCKVYLENYSGVYYAGSEIRGKVECYFDEETSVRGIKIRIKCKEHNSWSGTETYRDPADGKTKTRYITLTGDNNVLYVEQMLFGSASSTREIQRGRHVYPFTYRLPEDIPTTFKGPHGGITYKVKAIVDRPMRVDYEDEFIFQVQSPIDFNKLSQEYQDITNYSDEKSVCCWCCKGGDITMDVELPKTGFVAGERVPFKVSITNLSNSNVDNLKVKFKKTITYKVTSPHSESKEDEEEILSLVEHGVGAHGEYTYNLQLAIPSHIEVPNFAKCELFKVTYELKACAEMPACTLDLDISAWDIKMGHIQFMGGENHRSQNNVPPEGAFGYAPPPGGYAPPPGGYAPPQGGFASPQGGFAPPPGGYAPPQGGFAPPPGGYAPPHGGFASPPPYPPEKGAAPGGPPSAPTSIASAPVDDNSKAAEAARPGAPYGPHSSNVPEMPPPSYNQVQQNAAPYPPQ